MTGLALPRWSLGARALALLAFVFSASVPLSAAAQSTAFRQAVAEAAARDRDLAEFYRANGYEPIWTGSDRNDRQRLKELLRAVSQADDHGLPVARYEPDTLETNLRRVRSDRELGQLEVEMSRLFLLYARDVQSGILTPSRIDPDIKRRPPLRDRAGLLSALSNSSPRAFFQALPPSSPEYTRLMKEKQRFARLMAENAWGEPARSNRTIRPGDSGNDVVSLRNRLIRMGYLDRTATTSYDQKMQAAVRAFQADHGLLTDGVVGPGTLDEINQQPAARLSQIIVAMERERWINHPDGLGKRHIWVNLPDFRTRVVDNGKVTFETRSVVGERKLDKRTPEFSDMMEYMELNPDWTVPRSILGRDYLPKMKEDPYAARYLQLIDDSGRVVSRDEIDFSKYTEETFPFKVRQPPGDLNALGLVKFMFPNPHAIYLHDTPAKNLFAREVRAYSSGCIRLNEPFELAYHLLARQVSNPRQFFDSRLASGQQMRIDLRERIPVHLVYRTAFTEPKGRIQFRRDFYGRDGKIFDALRNAGVALTPVRG